MIHSTKLFPIFITFIKSNNLTEYNFLITDILRHTTPCYETITVQRFT